MKVKAVILASTICFLLTSCATLGAKNILLKNHEDDYLKSENLPPLRIPTGVSMYPPDTYYTVANGAPQRDVQVSILPPGSYAQNQFLAKNTGANHAKR